MKEIFIFSWICSFIVQQAELRQERKRKDKLIKFGLNPENISREVNLINIQNIKIGNNTYMNSGQLFAGETASITIGDWCAIGYNVHVKAFTHDIKRPTGSNLIVGDGVLEKDIIIGNYVWIGDNVFIREGIKIDDYAIIGANSVVTKNVSSHSVVGGVPAKPLYFIHQQASDLSKNK